METLKFVGAIYRKNKSTLYIDAKDVPNIVDDINANDFVYMSMYKCTIHKFDIDEIKIVKFTTPIAKEIAYEIRNIADITQPSLSFTDYVSGLQKKQLSLT